MSKRLNLRQIIPESYQVLMQWDELIEKSGINKLQLQLVKIRASQINGCAFCMNMHIKDAIKAGEDPKRIYVLSGWREAKNWFTQADQTILKLTEEITLIAASGLSDETYEEAIGLFGEEITAQLIMAVIHINALNRVGVSLNMHPL